MRLHRIYYPFIAEVEQNVLIENERAHYLRNVLRLKVGNKVKIFNHKCQEFLAQIVAINKKTTEVILLKSINTIAPSKLNITLIQSMSKGERMDYTVQKATELGISTIQPITSEFCEAKLKGRRLEKKLLHWRNISISACEQSFRADIPELLPPISIQNYSMNKHQGILLEPEESQTIGQIAKNKWHEFDIVIGPEGGWSTQDLDLLKNTGLISIQFGQRILRTETMAPAILAAIHSLWGDFI